MQNVDNLVNVAVTWRGNKYNVEVDSHSSLKDLGDELLKLTGIRVDTMRLIVPQVTSKGSKLLYPFSDEHAPLSLTEAHITEGKIVRMMGVSEVEVDKVLENAKVDLRIAGFDEEEKRIRQRSSYRPQRSIQLPQGPYIFCDFRTLQLPGITLNPPASEALKRMHMLASDPGIVATMNKHRWRVGIMTEMAPIGYVGVSPKCLLGFNKNHGEEISLRLRTDDLKGFRKYEVIKKTLLHELAHMVYSEHDANFYALDRQLNQEADSLDWTKSRGHTLSRFKHEDNYEEDIEMDSVNTPQKLGGSMLDPLASARASSVAAAYWRLVNAPGDSAVVSEEPDPDDTMHISPKEPKDVQSTHAYHEPNSDGNLLIEIKYEPDPDEHRLDESKDEPDPDDSLGNQHQINETLTKGIHPGNITNEPDPDDVGVTRRILEEQNTGSPDTNGLLASKKVLDSKPDPDDHLVSVQEISSMQIENKYEPDPDDEHRLDESKDEPDPDDSLGDQHQINKTLTKGIHPGNITNEPDPDDVGVTRRILEEQNTGSPDTNGLLASNKVLESEPDPDDRLVSVQEISSMQIDEPDPDDQELRRIQEPVAAFCNRLQKAIDVLRAGVDPTEAASALQTLFKIIRNVIEHPNEVKFRRLRKANPIIQKNIANKKAAMDLLQMIGFDEEITRNELGTEETYLVLKRNDPGLLWLAKSSFEAYDAHRA